MMRLVLLFVLWGFGGVFSLGLCGSFDAGRGVGVVLRLRGRRPMVKYGRIMLPP